MTRVVRGFLIWIPAALALLVAALVLFLLLFDWNLLRPTIKSACLKHWIGPLP